MEEEEEEEEVEVEADADPSEESSSFQGRSRPAVADRESATDCSDTGWWSESNAAGNYMRQEEVYLRQEEVYLLLAEVHHAILDHVYL